MAFLFIIPVYSANSKLDANKVIIELKELNSLCEYNISQYCLNKEVNRVDNFINKKNDKIRISINSYINQILPFTSKDLKTFYDYLKCDTFLIELNQDLEKIINQKKYNILQLIIDLNVDKEMLGNYIYKSNLYKNYKINLEQFNYIIDSLKYIYIYTALLDYNSAVFMIDKLIDTHEDYISNYNEYLKYKNDNIEYYDDLKKLKKSEKEFKEITQNYMKYRDDYYNDLFIYLFKIKIYEKKMMQYNIILNYNIIEYAPDYNNNYYELQRYTKKYDIYNYTWEKKENAIQTSYVTFISKSDNYIVSNYFHLSDTMPGFYYKNKYIEGQKIRGYKILDKLFVTPEYSFLEGLYEKYNGEITFAVLNQEKNKATIKFTDHFIEIDANKIINHLYYLYFLINWEKWKKEKTLDEYINDNYYKLISKIGREE